MTDFLEQVVAERRADATRAESAAPAVDLARDAKDNVWARATKDGTSDELLRSWDSGAWEDVVPVREAVSA